MQIKRNVFNMKKGALITMEGIEGSGKSTQVNILAVRLKKIGLKVIVVREPGTTKLGEEIRHLIKNSKIAPETEMLLFAAARAELVNKIIKPALLKGKLVLSDRFSDSMIIYQGIIKKNSLNSLRMINNLTAKSIVPKLTIINDLSAEKSIYRARRRVEISSSNKNKNIIHSNIKFYKLIRNGFLNLTKRCPERFLIVDSSRNIKSIEVIIWNSINEIIKSNI